MISQMLPQEDFILYKSSKGTPSSQVQRSQIIIVFLQDVDQTLCLIQNASSFELVEPNSFSKVIKHSQIQFDSYLDYSLNIAQQIQELQAKIFKVEFSISGLSNANKQQERSCVQNSKYRRNTQIFTEMNYLPLNIDEDLQIYDQNFSKIKTISRMESIKIPTISSF